jgi:hypothetical protein
MELWQQVKNTSDVEENLKIYHSSSKMGQEKNELCSTIYELLLWHFNTIDI